MAIFKVNKVFEITNRGTVLSGQILEGEIAGGDFVQVELNGNIVTSKIKSVEFVDYGNGYAETGLILGTPDKTIENLLKAITDKTIAVTKYYSD